MKRILPLVLALCLFLWGCEGWMDESYHSVTFHPISGEQGSSGTASVETYNDLLTAIDNMVQSGTETGTFSAPRYDPRTLELHMERAVSYTMEFQPIAAYAVEKIEWELGTSGGQTAVAVNITYLHDRTELRNIRRVTNLDTAKEAIYRGLDECASGVVMYVQTYKETDLEQLVSDYADANPRTVMEKPQVVANVYPRSGVSRVVEVKFLYQNSRDALRSMQSQVSPVFAAAVLYVSGDASDTEKLSQLYSFLMERYEYRIETSITPAYSLLRHGVGDEKAFAMVYAAMCRQAGMECMVVTGTRSGEPWYWNLVRDGETYYHVDLLRCNAQGSFAELTDGEMDGYVWDYSAYPKSVLPTPTEPENP